MLNTTVTQKDNNTTDLIAIIYCSIMIFCCICGCWAFKRCPQTKVFPHL